MASKSDLEEMLKAESGKPDEMCTEWHTISLAAARRAVVRAYNTGLEDAIDSVHSTIDESKSNIEKLKIQ